MADPKQQISLPAAAFFNVMRVSHTPTEFFFELSQMAGDQPGVAQLISRVVTTPQHAKSILDALRENILKYEEKHGEIRMPKVSPAAKKDLQ